MQKRSLDPLKFAKGRFSIYDIQQISADPLLPLSVKVLQLEDYKSRQFGHQQSLKLHLEQIWLGSIRNGLVQQLEALQFEITTSMDRIKLLAAAKANSSYKNLKQPSLSKELIQFGK